MALLKFDGFVQQFIKWEKQTNKQKNHIHPTHTHNTTFWQFLKDTIFSIKSDNLNRFLVKFLF